MAESTSSSPIFDPKSPYYLHPDFEIGNFRINKLSQAEDNYVIWKIRFLGLLRIMNKVGFIDGTLEKPEPSSPLYEPWEQCNATVMWWLMSSMTEKLLKSVILAETVHKMWKDLRLIFVPSVDLKIYQLRRRLAALRQDGDSVAKYFGKLSKAWMELSEYDPVPECSCGGCKCETKKRAKETREKEQLCTFLMGLNKDFDSLISIIMFKEPPPSLHEAYGIVEQAESRMK